MKHHLKPLAACMAAMFGATSFNVWGAPPSAPPVQNQNVNGAQSGTGTPTATVPPVLATRPMTSVFPTQPKEFPGIPWGTFLLYPEVTLAVTYDDNIYAERPFLTPDRTYVTEDVVYTLSPSLELKSNWKQHALNLDLGADLDRYRNHDTEDVNDYWLGFDGHYDLSARTNLFGGARHSRDHEDRSTPGSLLTQTRADPLRPRGSAPGRGAFVRRLPPARRRHLGPVRLQEWRTEQRRRRAQRLPRPRPELAGRAPGVCPVSPLRSVRAVRHRRPRIRQPDHRPAVQPRFRRLPRCGRPEIHPAAAAPCGGSVRRRDAPGLRPRRLRRSQQALFRRAGGVEAHFADDRDGFHRPLAGRNHRLRRRRLRLRLARHHLRLRGGAPPDQQAVGQRPRRLHEAAISRASTAATTSSMPAPACATT